MRSSFFCWIANSERFILTLDNPQLSIKYNKISEKVQKSQESENYFSRALIVGPLGQGIFLPSMKWS